VVEIGDPICGRTALESSVGREARGADETVAVRLAAKAVIISSGGGETGHTQSIKQSGYRRKHLAQSMAENVGDQCQNVVPRRSVLAMAVPQA